MLSQGKIERKQSVQLLFTLLLLFALIMCGMFTVVFGAEVYKNITGRAEDSFNASVPLSYITNKVRQGDSAGNLRVEDEDGVSVLKLRSFYDGQPYETWIYAYKGRLMEIFQSQGAGIPLSEGMEIMPLNDARFNLSGSRLTCSISCEGRWEKMSIGLKSAEGGGAFED